MARKAKVTLKRGDYVRVNKTTTGVVTFVNSDETTDARAPWQVDIGQVGVSTIDKHGDTDFDGYNPEKLTKMPAPQYVVVWTDEYQDPFAQFSTRAEADTFAAKLRKNKDIVEVRVYKLTK